MQINIFIILAPFILHPPLSTVGAVELRSWPAGLINGRSTPSNNRNGRTSHSVQPAGRSCRARLSVQ